MERIVIPFHTSQDVTLHRCLDVGLPYSPSAHRLRHLPYLDSFAVRCCSLFLLVAFASRIIRATNWSCIAIAILAP